MTAITTAMIKELREATGAGILDSKKVLEEVNGDFDKAVESLREKGLARAAKKASREANEGLVAAKVDDAGAQAALVEVNCETDFVARTDDFANFVDAITRQVYEGGDISSVESLLEAPFINNESKSVADAIQDAVSKLGENIIIRGATQYKLNGEGLIDSYIHANSRVGVLVEVGTEGAVSDRDALQTLAHDLAMQIAAVKPQYLSRDDVPETVVDGERKVLMAQLAEENKPDNIKARIVEGRLNKFYAENCLLEQEFVKDGSLTISKLLQQAGKDLGVPIQVKRFTRYELGAS